MIESFGVQTDNLVDSSEVEVVIGTPPRVVLSSCILMKAHTKSEERVVAAINLFHSTCADSYGRCEARTRMS